MSKSSNLILVIIIIVQIILFASISEARWNIGYLVPNEPPRALYNVEADINIDAGIIKGRGTIEFTNNAFKSLTVIAFRMLRNTDLWISINGKQLEVFNTDKYIQFLKLPEPLKSGAKISLDMEFTFSGLEFGTSGVYASSYWIPHLWWDGIPHISDFRVKITPLAGHAIAVSGRLDESAGYFEGFGLRMFGIYIGKEMKSESVDVGHVRIYILFNENQAEGARYCLSAAEDVVNYYKEWLGFYPFNFLYVLPGGSGVSGGYPMATGMVRIHGLQKFPTANALHWTWITSHEIGHQYWGEYVLDGDNPQWLWIGMGVYADREYTFACGIGAERQISMMRRFIYALENGYDTTIDVTADERRKLDFDYNSLIRHGKGFSFISALELTIGKETFQRAYKRALSEYSGKRLGWKDFQKLCEEESGDNLNWFFNQWVRADKYLFYRITERRSYEQNNKWVSEITVKREGTLAMPIPVQAIFEDGTSQTRFTDRTKVTNVLIFESESRLWAEKLDPENRLPMLTKQLPPPTGPAAELIRSLPPTGVGPDAYRIYRAALEQKMDDGEAWFNLGLRLFDGGYNKEAYHSFIKSVDSEPSNVFVFASYAWMGMMQDLMGNHERAISHYQEALKIFGGNTMSHSQFGLEINKSWVEKLIKDPFKW